MSGKNRKLVVVQLSGGNDYLNCIVPYSDPNYIDNRPNVRLTEDEVIPLDNGYGLNPSMGPIKDLYDQGKVAIIHGVGYPVPNRSHFRSMDIWHTAEPTKVGEQGWLGRAINEITPGGENVVVAVNFGSALPRALVAPGAPVATVSNLDTYGLLNHIGENDQRTQALEAFRKMYASAIGTGPVIDYLSKTGLDALRGADILSSVPETHTSTVEYGENPFAHNIKGAAQVLQADIGTRICYTQYGSFDTHTNELALQGKLWTDVAGGIYDLYTDLKAHNASDDVLIFVFSEFGRRVKDNGNGTDHGSGGVSFLIGDHVEGGHYSEYPSLAADKLVEGDLAFNLDFRSVYTEILEDWLEVEAKPIVKGTYEKVGCFN
ncbi:MAG: hypothetical protein ETSY1_15045 [Candidatus Entotheonella factor]|uniref:DUF1501 domain-containing protein n=1 Tax=Entotheonella factor TaxID=1429438 RepID=W4LNY4_ENTF1|nr:DUF1501 domain-containing protein [Candidatus Entotheonella palauensis]ETW99430.1 MAG: hypothetical protein ETSY1_15045 [Candidatus Entotheonella factor]